MMATEIRDHLDAFNAHNRERVGFVNDLKVEDYERAKKNLDAARTEMAALFTDYDVFISPSLPGEAPVGLDLIHSAIFASLWTQMHTPSVSLPLFTNSS